MEKKEKKEFPMQSAMCLFSRSHTRVAFGPKESTQKRHWSDWSLLCFASPFIARDRQNNKSEKTSIMEFVALPPKQYRWKYSNSVSAGI
jgi:hypothetical protein